MGFSPTSVGMRPLEDRWYFVATLLGATDQLRRALHNEAQGPEGAHLALGPGSSSDPAQQWAWLVSRAKEVHASAPEFLPDREWQLVQGASTDDLPALVPLARRLEQMVMGRLRERAVTLRKYPPEIAEATRRLEITSDPLYRGGRVSLEESLEPKQIRALQGWRGRFLQRALAKEWDPHFLDTLLTDRGLPSWVDRFLVGAKPEALADWTVDWSVIPPVVQERLHLLLHQYANIVWAADFRPLEQGVLTALAPTLPTPSVSILYDLRELVNHYLFGDLEGDARLPEGRFFQLLSELVVAVEKARKFSELVRAVERSPFPFEPAQREKLLAPLRVAAEKGREDPGMGWLAARELLRPISPDFGLLRKAAGFSPFAQHIADRRVVTVPVVSAAMLAEQRRLQDEVAAWQSKEAIARARIRLLEYQVRAVRALAAGTYQMLVDAEAPNADLERAQGWSELLGEREELVGLRKVVSQLREELAEIQRTSQGDKERLEQERDLALARIRETRFRFDQARDRANEQLRRAHLELGGKRDVIDGLQARIILIADALDELERDPTKAQDPAFWAGLRART